VATEKKEKKNATASELGLGDSVREEQNGAVKGQSKPKQPLEPGARPEEERFQPWSKPRESICVVQGYVL
jgi:hypothetical protein